MRKQLLLSALVLVALTFTMTASAESTGQFDRTLKVTGTPDIEVSTGSGDITIRSGDSGTIHVVGHIHASSMSSWFGGGASSDEKIKRLEANPPIEQTGNMVRIGRIEDPDLRRNISISYEVTLPANSNLRANTGSGNAQIDGISAPVKVSTGSGDVSLRNISGEVRANTGSGNVSGENIKANFHGETGSGDVRIHGTGTGDVFASTGSGNIEVQDMKGSLRARTGSGDVMANGVATSAWDVQTGSGNVRMQLPGNAAFELNAETSSGSIDINREIMMSGQLNKHHIRGKVNGGGTLLTLRTGSGDIQIK
jgi:Putative adhesin